MVGDLLPRDRQPAAGAGAAAPGMASQASPWPLQEVLMGVGQVRNPGRDWAGVGCQQGPQALVHIISDYIVII